MLLYVMCRYQQLTASALYESLQNATGYLETTLY